MRQGMAASNESWSRQRVREAAREVMGSLDSFEELKSKGPRRVIRYPIESDKSVILKIWAGRSLKTRLAGLLRISSVCREARSLLRAKRLGVRVPSPLGFATVSWKGGVHGGAIVLEDLGNCAPAMSFIKDRIANAEEDRLAVFESRIVEMTAAMVRGNLLDEDHGILNMVVAEGDQPIRLDLERARRVISRNIRYRLYGRMLGRLLATYTFAVQPETQRTFELAIRLKEETRPSRFAWEQTKEYVEERMRVQREQKGYKMTVQLPPWA